MKHKLFALLGLFIILLLWQFYAIYVNQPILVPDVINVSETLLQLLRLPSTYVIILNTLIRLMFALGVSAIFGLVFGLLSAFFPTLKDSLSLIVTTLRSVPVVSVIVIVWILSGARYAPYVITFLMVFPLVYQAILEGVKSLASENHDVWKLDTKLNVFVIYNVHIPLITPFIKTAFYQSVGLGIKVLVMSEFITQTPNSMGKKIFDAKQLLDYSGVFAWTVLLIVVVLGIEALVNTIKRK